MHFYGLNLLRGFGRMIQKIKALASLEDDLSPFPTAMLNGSQLPVTLGQGDPTSLASMGFQMCEVYINSYRHTHTHVKIDFQKIH